MLDVSSNNHPNGFKFDYQGAADAGYGMAYVKATQGDYYTNPYMAQDVAGFQAAGLKVGIYHYFDPAVSIEAQATYFLRYGMKQVHSDLMPVVDYEMGSPDKAQLAAFQHLIPCRVYVDRSWASALELAEPYWLAWPGWTDEPLTKYGPAIAAIQTGAATIPGLGMTDTSTVLDPTAFEVVAVPTIPSSPYPIVGMATCAKGGYWLVNSAGQVYALGAAPYHGNTPTLAKPAVGIVGTASGDGYYIVASDGGVFTFGDAVFEGSLG